MFKFTIQLLSISILLIGTFAVSIDLSSTSDVEENLSALDKDTIIGGHNASISDHPYQVSLSYKTSDNFICGGSIISSSFIITADHCSYYFKEASDIIARAGSVSRETGTVIPISDIIYHPDHGVDLDLDVILLKTKKQITFTDIIRPIELPVKQTPLQDNSIVTVSGWGLTTEGSVKIPIQLMAVKIPVVNFYDCWKVYGYALTRNMWCAGDFKSGGKGPCSGDSGGPAVQNGVLYGIVSWSHGCAEPKHPTVFTDVAAPAIRDFIANYTGL